MRVRGVDGGDGGAVFAALRGALEGSGPAVGLGAPDVEGVEVPEGTAVVIGTSGSTGRPKQVVLSRDALVASARATSARIGEGTWVLALPAGYVAGVQVLTRSLVGGTAPVLLGSGGFDTTEFAVAAASMPRPAYTSLVPAQLARLLDVGVDLTAFAAILVGGQRLEPSLRTRAVAAGVRIVRTYGSTETSGGCVYDGVPLDGVSLRITDGEVMVAGPTLATGYLGDDLATEAAFPRDPDGARWYRTGDTGELRDATLAVTGRIDDVYVSGGVNVSVGRVQDAVRTVPGLEHAVVVAIPDERWGEASVVVVPTGTGPVAHLDAVRDAVGGAVGLPARPTRLVLVDRLPVLASGKPDLAALRRLAASDH